MVGYAQMETIAAGKTEQGLSAWAVFLMAIACGLSVANIYLAQPLLDVIAGDVHIQKQYLGGVISLTQLGYGLGLLFIVPLGDLWDRRRLVTAMMVMSALVLAVLGTTSNTKVFFFAVAILGLFAVIVQILVAFAASMASPEKSGEVVGRVTSGVVIGILLGRMSAGWMADLFGWRSIYLLSALMTMIVAMLLFNALPRTGTQQDTEKSYAALVTSVFKLLINSQILRRRAVLALLLFANFNVLWGSLGLMLVSDPHSLSLTSVGLFGLAGAAGAVGAAQSGKLADRGLGQWGAGIGLLALFCAWLMLGFTGNFLWIVAAGVFVLDFGIQVVHVSNQNMIFSAHPTARSRVVAAYMLFYSIGSALGATASTALFVWRGWNGVCILGGALSVLAIAYWCFDVFGGYRK